MCHELETQRDGRFGGGRERSDERVNLDHWITLRQLYKSGRRVESLTGFDVEHSLDIVSSNMALVHIYELFCLMYAPFVRILSSSSRHKPRISCLV